MKTTVVRRNGHMTGMQGVYLAAAELTRLGLIVSPTSRSSFGADLLVTDSKCRRAWSVQVKTNFGRPTFWLLNKHSRETRSNTHVYVLVNLGQATARQRLSPPDFFVVPSRMLARNAQTIRRKTGAVFYSIRKQDVSRYKNSWKPFLR